MHADSIFDEFFRMPGNLKIKALLKTDSPKYSGWIFNKA